VCAGFKQGGVRLGAVALLTLTKPVDRPPALSGTPPDPRRTLLAHARHPVRRGAGRSSVVGGEGHPTAPDPPQPTVGAPAPRRAWPPAYAVPVIGSLSQAPICW
jgi:hypothetical protein